MPAAAPRIFSFPSPRGARVEARPTSRKLTARSVRDSPNTQVVLKNMSKTNPVVLNGASIAGATGVALSDGDEVVFPSAESERIVFKYRLVAKETGAALGTVKSVGGAEANTAAPKSPLGDRNGEGMVAKSPAKKAPTPAKKAPTPAKSAKSAAKSPGPTPYTRASRALVASAVEALVAAENDAAAANQASPAKMAATPAKSPAKMAPKSAGKSSGLTPHTRAARDIVASAVDSLVAEEAAAMKVDEEPEEAATAKSPAASKSPASARKSPRSAKKRSASPAAPAAAEPAATSPASPADSPAKAPASDVCHDLKAAPSPMLSPRPSLKAPEARIGAQVPGSASRRKSLGIRFVADEAIEQVRFIPPHNGEPEVCGRIAPNQMTLLSSEKRKRTPTRRFSDAISEGVEEEEAEDDAPVNRVGCVGHTGPIPRFEAKAPESDAARATDDATAVPAASPSTRSSSRKRSLASPVSTGACKRSAVSFAIGQAEVTDDVAGTPVEQKRRGSSGFKRKGTPHAPPSRVDEEEEEDEDEEEGEENEEEMDAEEELVTEETTNDETGDEAMEEEEEEEEVVVEGLDVTVVEEGVLGSGGTGAPSSVAGTVLDETDADASGSALGGDTADDIPDIPVFRLGDVGNTGPIPHYSPACKASPMSTIKSAVKSSPRAEAPPSTGGRSMRSTRSRRSSAGVGGRAPANTPAAGPAAAETAAAAAAALVRGLEGIASTIAQTPGGHAKHSAVARILAAEAEEEASLSVKAATPAEASPAPTMLDVDVTREEIISAATPFVERAEAAAAAEAAEAAAEAGAAAAARAVVETEDDAPAFDFDEAFAVDAALAVEGVADVEAAVEIEQALEAAQGKTPEKVEKWLEQNLAEALVEAEAEAVEDADADADAGATSPGSAGRAEIKALSPATVIIKARGGSAGGRLRGGLSSRVAQIHRALGATRAALLREKQTSADLKKLYLAAVKQASEAREVAAAAAAEVAAAAAAAVEATAELQEAKNAPKEVIELKIVVAEPAPAPEPQGAEADARTASEDAPHAECDSDKCKICGVADERDALLCDGCDGAFHMGCLKPPRKRVPAGDWFCKPCAAERKPAPKRRAAAPAEGGTRRSTRARG